MAEPNLPAAPSAHSGSAGISNPQLRSPQKSASHKHDGEEDTDKENGKEKGQQKGTIEDLQQVSHPVPYESPVSGTQQQEDAQTYPPQCTICSKQLWTPGQAKSHHLSHKWDCPYCGKKSITARAFVAHKATHVEKSDLTTDPNPLGERRPHVQEQLDCKHCPQRFKLLEELRHHHEASHPKQTLAPFMCTMCGKSFKSYVRCSIHLHDTETTPFHERVPYHGANVYVEEDTQTPSSVPRKSKASAAATLQNERKRLIAAQREQDQQSSVSVPGKPPAQLQGRYKRLYLLEQQKDSKVIARQDQSRQEQHRISVVPQSQPTIGIEEQSDAEPTTLSQVQKKGPGLDRQPSGRSGGNADMAAKKDTPNCVASPLKTAVDECKRGNGALSPMSPRGCLNPFENSSEVYFDLLDDSGGITESSVGEWNIICDHSNGDDTGVEHVEDIGVGVSEMGEHVKGVEKDDEDDDEELYEINLDEGIEDDEYEEEADDEFEEARKENPRSAGIDQEWEDVDYGTY